MFGKHRYGCYETDLLAVMLDASKRSVESFRALNFRLGRIITVSSWKALFWPLIWARANGQHLIIRFY